MVETPTSERFGLALMQVLRERPEYLTSSGNVAWARLAQELSGVSYETLRKAVAGERPPSVRLVELVAAALGLDPVYFLEYRLVKAREALDPQSVGLEQAAENLAAWEQAREDRIPT